MNEASRAEGAARLSATIHFFGDLLGRVIRAQEGERAFALEERVRALAKDVRSGAASQDELRALLASTHQQEVREVLSALLNVLEGDERAGRLEDRVMTKPPTVGDSVFGLTKPGFLR